MLLLFLLNVSITMENNCIFYTSRTICFYNAWVQIQVEISRQDIEYEK